MGEAPERVKSRWGCEAVDEMTRERLELTGEIEGLGLGRLRRKPAPEVRDGLDKINVRPARQIGGRWARVAVLQPEARERLQGLDDVVRIVSR